MKMKKPHDMVLDSKNFDLEVSQLTCSSLYIPAASPKRNNPKNLIESNSTLYQSSAKCGLLMPPNAFQSIESCKDFFASGQSKNWFGIRVTDSDRC
mmetsp:Transcript_35940/g.70725  ORF Transcript_35940/g.70725 Transcript_35940/m.70725 type:complete len:96 (-) Transcript_35940:307-594(-)|eukprot:CAMPEP_0194306318 /NCGR_PEP_ID=MMETSP0171-20130528/3523_1 /TAXON_ID=218684 /ORGANISM="Corethron pennatum, Strain L29A3" /LENGTH=95 /DNA_ID=CAMNT_0039058079 /DNA_START=115 /DNA_END=402 /DNA_ORIENTATION=-